MGFLSVAMHLITTAKYVIPPAAVCAQQTHSSCLSWLQVGDLVEGNIDGKVKQVLDYLHPNRATTTPQETSAPSGSSLPPPSTQAPNYLNPKVSADQANKCAASHQSTCLQGALKYMRIRSNTVLSRTKTEKAPCAPFPLGTRYYSKA